MSGDVAGRSREKTKGMSRAPRRPSAQCPIRLLGRSVASQATQEGFDSLMGHFETHGGPLERRRVFQVRVTRVRFPHRAPGRDDDA
jgi:hypothetical protein